MEQRYLLIKEPDFAVLLFRLQSTQILLNLKHYIIYIMRSKNIIHMYPIYPRSAIIINYRP